MAAGQATRDALLARVAALESQLAAAEQMIDRTWDQAAVATAMVSLDGRFLRTNTAFRQLVNRSEDELTRLSTHHIIEPDDCVRHNDLLARTIDRQLPGYRTETRLRRPDGTLVWADVAAAMVLDAHGSPMHLILQAVDITERKNDEEQLRRLAQLDPLTGLLNRAALEDVIEHAEHEAIGAGTQVAIVMVDLDDFKPINDQHGHDAGDAVLRTVAKRLVSAIRPGDTAARVGGDEFVLVCRGVRSAADAEAFVHRVRTAMTAPIDIGHKWVVVGASLGYHLTDVREPIRASVAAADAAMYVDKHGHHERTGPVVDLRDPRYH